MHCYCLLELPDQCLRPGEERLQVFAVVEEHRFKQVMDYSRLRTICAERGWHCPAPEWAHHFNFPEPLEIYALADRIKRIPPIN